MRSPSSEEILAIWEAALAEHPLDRALTIAAAFSGQPKCTVAQLPVGMRDSLLFQARERVFGSRLDMYAECPSCKGSLEFAVAIDHLPLSPCGESEIAGAAGMVYETAGGVAYRLPNSFDLAAIAATTDPGEAERILVRRCIVRDDIELNERAVAEVNRAIAEHDAGGDLELAVTCPGCGERWDLILDIASCFWRELNSYVKRLVSEVDILARAYGWPERDILNLTPARRAIYLQMVTGS